MKYPTLIAMLLWPSHLIYANTPLHFRNDSDKKVRITLRYKRYNNVGKNVRYEKRTHKFSTYVKPNESIRVNLRSKHYDDLKVHSLIATNTRRRNDWDGLLLKELAHHDTFTMIYNEKNCFQIIPSSGDTHA